MNDTAILLLNGPGVGDSLGDPEVVDVGIAEVTVDGEVWVGCCG